MGLCSELLATEIVLATAIVLTIETELAKNTKTFQNFSNFRTEGISSPLQLDSMSRANEKHLADSSSIFLSTYLPVILSSSSRLAAFRIIRIKLHQLKSNEIK